MTPDSCSHCERKGILIYPVRYAIACPYGAEAIPDLPKNFGIDSAPIDARPAKYTLRSLRKGFLYTYDEKRRRLTKYKVRANGGLWKIPERYVSTEDPNPTYVCHSVVRAAISHCIDIAHSPEDPAGKLWLGWSAYPISMEALSNIGDIGWRRKFMQCIDVPAMQADAARHAGEFNRTLPSIPHFSCTDTNLDKAFSFSSAPLEHEKKQLKRRTRLANVIKQYSEGNRGYIAAINDPAGVTQDFGNLTLPLKDSGFDEKLAHGYIIHDVIKNLEIQVRGQARQARIALVGQSSFHLGTVGNPLHIGTPLPPRPLAPATESELSLLEDKAWAALVSDGEKSVLDAERFDAFPDEMERALMKFKPVSVRLASLHAAWLSSSQLADWMSAVHSTVDIRSGFAYRQTLEQCIGAGVATDESQKVLQKWMNSGAVSDARNLYARALLFNQEQIISAVEPHLKASDLPLESIFAVYKRAVDQLAASDKLNAIDRLVLTTANVLAWGATKTATVVARNLTILGLSFASGTRIRATNLSAHDLRTWLIAQVGKREGLKDRMRTVNRASALRTAKVAIAEKNKSITIVAFELDVEQLTRSGHIDVGALRPVGIPGEQQIRKWLNSPFWEENRLGMVASVLQLIAVKFALDGLSEADQFNRSEVQIKAIAAGTTVISSVIEMLAVEALKKRPESLNSYWVRSERLLNHTVLIARRGAFLAGCAVAAIDITKGYLGFNDGEKAWGATLMLGGLLSIVLASLAAAGTIAWSWLLLASVTLSLFAPLLAEAELRLWLRRCYFSGKGSKYQQLSEELAGFSKAVGG